MTLIFLRSTRLLLAKPSTVSENLGIPAEKVKPKGGAIAFGHPLGCTGARMISTLLYEMTRRKKRDFGIVSMCMGTGMGAAALFEHSP